MKSMKISKKRFLLYLCTAMLLFSGCASSKPSESSASDTGKTAESGSSSSGTGEATESNPSSSGTGEAAESNSSSSGTGEATESNSPSEGASAQASDNASAADTEALLQLPNFEMTLLNGETAALEDYRGKTVLLNFWATWCGPCVGEMPAFQRLTEDYPDDLVILAVNCSEDADTVQEFIDNNSYTFPVILDEDGTIQAMFGGITSIPMTIVLDAEGYVINQHLGAADADTMYEAYKEELGL